MKSDGPIIITGFMGCGKTEVARYLAHRLRVEMADLDEVIAKREGRTAAQLIGEEGESVFREIETNTLRDLLNTRQAGVIALGGGAWIEATNRNLIAAHNGISVWLDSAFEVCWERISASSEDRPLGRTRAQASELFDRRRPVYELAEIRVAVAPDDNPETLASNIEAKMPE